MNSPISMILDTNLTPMEMVTYSHTTTTTTTTSSSETEKVSFENPISLIVQQRRKGTDWENIENIGHEVRVSPKGKKLKLVLISFYDININDVKILLLDNSNNPQIYPFEQTNSGKIIHNTSPDCKKKVQTIHVLYYEVKIKTSGKMLFFKVETEYGHIQSLSFKTHNAGNRKRKQDDSSQIAVKPKSPPKSPPKFPSNKPDTPPPDYTLPRTNSHNTRRPSIDRHHEALNVSHRPYHIPVDQSVLMDSSTSSYPMPSAPPGRIQRGGNNQTNIIVSQLPHSQASVSVSRNQTQRSTKSSIVGSSQYDQRDELAGVANDNVVPTDLIVRGLLYAESFQQYSDERYKENIEDLVGALDLALQLQPKMYRWRDMDPVPEYHRGRRTIGFIAQQVEKFLPEAIETSQEGYKMVEYATIVPIIINALNTYLLQVQEFNQSQETQLKELSVGIQNLQGVVSDSLEKLNTIQEYKKLFEEIEKQMELIRKEYAKNEKKQWNLIRVLVGAIIFVFIICLIVLPIIILNVFNLVDPTQTTIIKKSDNLISNPSFENSDTSGLSFVYWYPKDDSFGYSILVFLNSSFVDYKVLPPDNDFFNVINPHSGSVCLRLGTEKPFLSGKLFGLTQFINLRELINFTQIISMSLSAYCYTDFLEFNSDTQFVISIRPYYMRRPRSPSYELSVYFPFERNGDWTKQEQEFSIPHENQQNLLGFNLTVSYYSSLPVVIYCDDFRAEFTYS